MKLVDLVDIFCLFMVNIINRKSFFVNATSICSYKESFPSYDSKRFTTEELAKIDENLNSKSTSKQLTGLDLSKNKIKILPEQINIFTDLTSLQISHNLLSSIPYNLCSLTFLSLENNLIKNIDIQICKMSNLKHLNISFNYISHLPSTFIFLHNLIDLNLAFNPIENLCDLPKNLINLNLNNLKIKFLPEQICQLKNLKTLDLSYNRILKLPKSFGKLLILERLDLSNTLFRKMPKQIFGLNNLKCLIFKNSILRSISRNIKNLKNLIVLSIENNLILDLPKEISELNCLKRLLLKRNHIRYLPLNLGNLINLEILDCSYNIIKTLPNSIVNLTNLIKMNLKSNKITCFPKNFGDLLSLEILDCEKNNILALPDSIKNLKCLKYLKCSNNRISELDACIGNLNLLEEIYFSENNIKNIPNSINKLINLEKLFFENNNVIRFPNDCENLINLFELHLSNNFLENFDTICKIKNLEILCLDSNKISRISENIHNLQKLNFLNLSCNHISKIPIEILKCKNLKNLNLKNNNIRTIPVGLIDFLCNLDYLDLRENPISFIGNSAELGYNELKKLLGAKLSIDSHDVGNIWQNRSIETLQFNLNNLKSCHSFALPKHIYTEQELCTKISNCEFVKLNFVTNQYRIFKSNFLIKKTKKLDTFIITDFINHLYHPEEKYFNFYVHKDYFNFYQGLIGAIVMQLFSLKNSDYINEYYLQLSDAICSHHKRQKSELIFLYERLLSNDKQNLSISLDLECKNNFLNPEIFLEDIIKKTVGKTKIKIFFQIFVQHNDVRNVDTYNHWKYVLRNHIGFEIYDVKNQYNEKTLHDCSIEFILKSFYEEFTPKYIILELQKVFNSDRYLCEKVVECVKHLGEKYKTTFLKVKNKDLTTTTEITIDFFYFILKKLKIIF